jgi:hypothetical protein
VNYLIFLLLQKTELDDANVDLPIILSESEYVLNNINITESDVVDLLNILDISKAIGPDGISLRILKEGASISKYPLCKIFNISLRNGVFPSDWKKANVCPVFNKDSPALLQNYRPISLISIVGKVMERCVFNTFPLFYAFYAYPFPPHLRFLRIPLSPLPTHSTHSVT